MIAFDSFDYKKNSTCSIKYIKICTPFVYWCWQCPAQGCRGRSFIPGRSSELTQTIDWQTIRIQEIMGEGMKESGRIPRTVDCELAQDLGKLRILGHSFIMYRDTCEIWHGLGERFFSHNRRGFGLHKEQKRKKWSNVD